MLFAPIVQESRAVLLLGGRITALDGAVVTVLARDNLPVRPPARSMSASSDTGVADKPGTWRKAAKSCSSSSR